MRLKSSSIPFSDESVLVMGLIILYFYDIVDLLKETNQIVF